MYALIDMGKFFYDVMTEPISYHDTWKAAQDARKAMSIRKRRIYYVITPDELAHARRAV